MRASLKGCGFSGAQYYIKMYVSISDPIHDLCSIDCHVINLSST